VPHEPFRYPRCCVVIPCYNEENRLDFARMEEFLQQYPDTGFFFVNDGSADNTKILLEKFSRKFPDRVSVMSFEKNRGKAEAVRQGVLCIGRGAGCEITGFWDADLSAPPEDMVKFREILRANPDLILAAGCR